MSPTVHPAWWLLACAACAPSIADLRLNAPPEDTDVDAPAAPAEPDEPGEPGDDAPALPSWRTTLDASAHDAWVHVDLVARELTDEGGPWTLAARRYVLAVDGGVSGEGGAEVAWVEGADHDPLDAPIDGWTTDQLDGDDEDVEPDRALDAWYVYDGSTHVLSPADRRWWVRAPGRPTVSLRFLDYYDRAGTSGFITLEAVVLPSPDTGGAP